MEDAADDGAASGGTSKAKAVKSKEPKKRKAADTEAAGKHSAKPPAAKKAKTPAAKTKPARQPQGENGAGAAGVGAATQTLPVAADDPDGECLRVGGRVEVQLLEDGLQGSWWRAIVVEVRNQAAGSIDDGPRSVLVEHEDIFDDDEGTTRTRETVSLPRGASIGARLPYQPRVRATPSSALPKPRVQQIRPRVPDVSLAQDLSAATWAVGDAVDARSAPDDGWFEGEIVMIDAQTGTITVSAPDEGVELSIALPPMGQGALRRTRIWTGTSWLVAPFNSSDLKALAAPTRAAPQSAAKKGVRVDIEPYIVPDDFDAAAAGIADADAESVNAFDRCSSSAIAKRWAQLREAVPAEDREVYQKGEHMRGHDLVLFEQARAEVWHVQGAAGTALGVTIKQLIQWGKRTIRALGYLQPIMLDSDDDGDGDGSDEDDAPPTDAAGGRSARKAALKGRAKMRAAAAPDAGEPARGKARGSANDSDDDHNVDAAVDDDDKEEEEDDEDVEEEEDNDDEDAGDKPRGRGAGRGRGRGGRTPGGRGRGAGGRGRGTAGRGRGGAALPASVQAALAPFEGDMKQLHDRFAVIVPAVTRAKKESLTAAEALDRFCSVAGVCVAWCPSVVGGASVLAGGMRSGHIALWKIRHDARPSAAPVATSLGSQSLATPSGGEWPSAIAWAPAIASSAARDAASSLAVLLTGGCAGTVTLSTCDLEACATALPWALDSSNATLLAPLASLATPQAVVGVPLTSACVARMPNDPTVVRAAVAQSWRVTVWMVPFLQTGSRSAVVPAHMHVQVSDTPLVTGLAWAHLSGALCAAAMDGTLHVWSARASTGGASSAEQARSLSDVATKLHTGGIDANKLQHAHGLALSPHGFVAVMPRAVVPPPQTTKYVPGGCIVMHTVPWHKGGSDVTEAALNAVKWLANAVGTHRVSGSSPWDVGHAIRRLVVPLSSENVRRVVVRFLTSVASDAGNDAKLRNQIALRHALAHALPALRSLVMAGLPAELPSCSAAEMKLLAKHATHVLMNSPSSFDAASRVRWASYVTAAASALAPSPQLRDAASSSLAKVRAGTASDPCPLCGTTLAFNGRGNAGDEMLETACDGPAQHQAGRPRHVVQRCQLSLVPRPCGSTWFTCPCCARVASTESGAADCLLCGTHMHAPPAGAHPMLCVMPGAPKSLPIAL